MTRHECALPVLMLSLAIGILVSPTRSRADTAWEKGGRGLASMTTPFLEIPGNIVETTDRHGALAGWTNGLARGLGMAIVRPPIGFYELVTAPIAAPKNFEPILEPEYPWSYFGSGDEHKVARHRSDEGRRVARH